MRPDDASFGTSEDVAPESWSDTATKLGVRKMAPEQRLEAFEGWQKQTGDYLLKKGELETPEAVQEWKRFEFKQKRKLSDRFMVEPRDVDVENDLSKWGSIVSQVESEKPPVRLIRHPEQYRESVISSKSPFDLKIQSLANRGGRESEHAQTRRGELTKDIAPRSKEIIETLQEAQEVLGVDVADVSDDLKLQKDEDGNWTIPAQNFWRTGLLSFGNVAREKMDEIKRYQDKWNLSDEEVQSDYLEAIKATAPTKVTRWFKDKTDLGSIDSRLKGDARVLNEDVGAPEVFVPNQALLFNKEEYDAAVDTADTTDDVKEDAKERRQIVAQAMAPQLFNNLLQHRDDFKNYAEEAGKVKGIDAPAAMVKAVSDYYKDKKDQSWTNDLGELIGQSGSGAQEGVYRILSMPSAIAGMMGNKKAADEAGLAASYIQSQSQADQAVAGNLGMPGVTQFARDFSGVVPDLVTQVGMAMGTGGAANLAAITGLTAKAGISTAAARQALQIAARSGGKIAATETALARAGLSTAIAKPATEALQALTSKNLLTGAAGRQALYQSGYAGVSQAASTFADTYQRLKADGMNEDEAFQAARVNGAVAGAITALVTGSFTAAGRGGVEKPLDPSQYTIRDLIKSGVLADTKDATSRALIKQTVKGFVKDIKDEALEEGIDQYLQGVASFVTDPSAKDKTLSEVFNDSLYAAGLGAAAGGAAAGIRNTQSTLQPGTTAETLKTIEGIKEEARKDRSKAAPPSGLAQIVPEASADDVAAGLEEEVKTRVGDVANDIAQNPDASQTAQALAAIAGTEINQPVEDEQLSTSLTPTDVERGSVVPPGNVFRQQQEPPVDEQQGTAADTGAVVEDQIQPIETNAPETETPVELQGIQSAPPGDGITETTTNLEESAGPPVSAESDANPFTEETSQGPVNETSQTPAEETQGLATGPAQIEPGGLETDTAPEIAGAEAVTLPESTGARKATSEGVQRVEEAKQRLRDIVNNNDLSPKDRADAIENGRNLIHFLQTHADTTKPLDTGYEHGDKVAYTGEDAPDGFRSFIFLEGHRAGQSGVAATPESRQRNTEEQQRSFRNQQEGFKRVRESGKSDQMPKQKSPGGEPVPASGESSGAKLNSPSAPGLQTPQADVAAVDAPKKSTTTGKVKSGLHIPDAPAGVTKKSQDAHTELRSLTDDFLPALGGIFKGVEIVDSIPEGKTGGFYYNKSTGKLGIILSDVARELGRVRDKKKWVAAAIAEEAIHSVATKLERQGKFDSRGLLRLIRRDAPEFAEMVKEIYPGAKTDQDLADELIRMLVQGRIKFEVGTNRVRINGELTEMQFSKSIIAKIKELMNKLLNIVRDLRKSNLPPAVAAELQKVQGMIESTLKSLVEQPNTRPPDEEFTWVADDPSLTQSSDAIKPGFTKLKGRQDMGDGTYSELYNVVGGPADGTTFMVPEGATEEEVQVAADAKTEQFSGKAFSQSVTPEQDAAYMAAVESGDMETAQRMVDEAAKKAGYNVGPVYHGGRIFSEFSTRVPGSTLGGTPKYFYFTTSEDNASFYEDGEIKKGYLKESQNFKEAEGTHPPTEADKAYIENFQDETEWGGVVVRDVLDGSHYSDIYAVFPDDEGTTQAFKSADPVTRDSDGNVIPLSQRFNPERDEIAYSQSPGSFVEPGFYSQLERTITAKMPVKASAAQIKGIVTNPQNRVKEEELKWTGLLPWLEAQSQPVSRDAVVEYLRNDGAVRFEEVDTSRMPDTTRGIEQNGVGKYTIRGGSFEIHKSGRVWRVYDPWSDEYIGEAAATPELAFAVNKELILRSDQELQSELPAPTRYSKFQLPGGTDYREVVLAMPPRTAPKPTGGSVVDIRESQGKWYHVTAGGRWGNEAFNSRQEAEAAMPEARYVDEIDETRSFTSTHFPDTPNYVAHMRLNEREDAAGDPGLFMEEIQSDRHQQGREKGYKTGELEAYQKSLMQKYGTTTVPQTWLKSTPDEQARWDSLRSQESFSDDAIPDAPFRQSWPLQLFKRALRDAVASGKKWIGWTTGETQAERYDLSKQLDSVRIVKRPNGSFYVAGRKDGESVIEKDAANASELADIIGKDLAAKAESQPADGSRREYSGLDLRVGGEGMKGFYDNILPKEVGKYVKQWGGKVEKGEAVTDAAVKIEGRRPGGNWSNSGETTKDKVEAFLAERREKFPELEWRIVDSSRKAPIWRVSITPEMKSGVEEGQIAFSQSPGSKRADEMGVEGLGAERINESRTAILKAVRDEIFDASKAEVDDPDDYQEVHDLITSLTKGDVGKAVKRFYNKVKDSPELAELEDPPVALAAVIYGEAIRYAIRQATDGTGGRAADFSLFKTAVENYHNLPQGAIEILAGTDDKSASALTRTARLLASMQEVSEPMGILLKWFTQNAAEATNAMLKAGFTETEIKAIGDQIVQPKTRKELQPAMDEVMDSKDADFAKVDAPLAKLQEQKRKKDAKKPKEETPSEKLVRDVGEDVAREEDFAKSVEEQAFVDPLQEPGEEAAREEDFAKRVEKEADMTPFNKSADKAIRRLMAHYAKPSNNPVGVRDIINAMMEFPEMASNPAWRKKVVGDWLKKLEIEIPRIKLDQLDILIANVFADAEVKLLKEFNAKRKNKVQPTEMEKIAKAIKVGMITGAPVQWQTAFLDKFGVKGLTPEQMRDVLHYSGVIGNDGGLYMQQDQAVAAGKMADIFRRAGPPPGFMELLAASYTTSSLSGLATQSLQFTTGAINLASRITEDLIRDVLTGTGITGILTAIGEAHDAWKRAFIAAFKNDNYREAQFTEIAKMDVLKTHLENVLKKFHEAGPLKKALLLPSLMAGFQDWSRRTMSAADDSAVTGLKTYIATAEKYRLLSKNGVTKDQYKKLYDVYRSELQQLSNEQDWQVHRPNLTYSNYLTWARDVAERNLNKNIQQALAEKMVLANTDPENAQRALDDISSFAGQEAAIDIGVNKTRDIGSKWDLPHYLGELIISAIEPYLRLTRSQQLAEGPQKPIGKRKLSPFDYLIVRMVVGFLRTPFNSMSRAVYRGPFGLYRLAITGALRPGKFSERAARLYARTMGTIEQQEQRRREAIVWSSMMAGLYLVAKALSDSEDDEDDPIVVTGSGPSDPQAREAWRAAGHSPNTIEINIGGTKIKVPYGRSGFEPMKPGLIALGAINDMEVNKLPKETSFPLWSWAKSFGNNTVYSTNLFGLKNIASWSRDTEGENRLLKKVAYMASPLIPFSGTQKSIGKLISTDKPDDKTLAGAIAISTPVWWIGEKALNMYGDKVYGTPSSTLGKVTNNLFWGIGLPFSVEFGDADKAKRAVYEFSLKTGRAPSSPDRNSIDRRLASQNKSHIPLSDSEWHDFQKAAGEEKMRSMKEFVPRSEGMSEDVIERNLEVINRRAYNAGRRAIQK